jgi:hypothetical protein
MYFTKESALSGYRYSARNAASMVVVAVIVVVVVVGGAEKSGVSGYC